MAWFFLSRFYLVWFCKRILACLLVSFANFPYFEYVEYFQLNIKLEKGYRNYRPISILPTLSKVYEKLLYHQMYPNFDKLFSKFQYGFVKGFNAQHCLITMIEKWWRSVDEGGQARCSSNWSFKSFWLYWSWIINSKALCLRFW